MRGALLAVLVLGAGCGSHQAARVPATTRGAATTRVQPPAAATTTAPAAPGALQAEARSAATGDVPDNQAFILYRNRSFTMKYPEGWAVRPRGGGVEIHDKNNIVRVVVQRGALPAAGAARKEIGPSARLRSAPKTRTIAGAPALALTYTTESAASPVTGKRTTLVVDRYYLAFAGKVAIVDLGTPEGVDNVDAYRLMIESFRWRR